MEFVAGTRDAANQLVANLQRAGELIQSFKQVAADRSYSALRSFDLAQCTEQTMSSLRPGLRKSQIEVKIEIPRGRCSAMTTMVMAWTHEKGEGSNLTNPWIQTVPIELLPETNEIHSVVANGYAATNGGFGPYVRAEDDETPGIQREYRRQVNQLSGKRACATALAAQI